MHYSLLDYLVWIVFLGSSVASLLNDEQWEVWGRLKNAGNPVSNASFSPDGKFVAIADQKAQVRYYSFPEEKLIWENTSLPEGDFAWLAFNEKWPLLKWEKLDWVGSAVQGKHKYLNCDDGLEIASPPQTDLGSWETWVASPGQRYQLVIRPRDKVPGVNVLHARYPNYWWGHFYRVEVQVALAALLFILYRIVKLRVSKRAA